MPGEKEVNEEGINVLEMDGLLLKKIEELTLHMIELEKQNRQLQDENARISKTIEGLNDLRQDIEIIKTKINDTTE